MAIFLEPYLHAKLDSIINNEPHAPTTISGTPTGAVVVVASKPGLVSTQQHGGGGGGPVEDGAFFGSSWEIQRIRCTHVVRPAQELVRVQDTALHVLDNNIRGPKPDRVN